MASSRQEKSKKARRIKMRTVATKLVVVATKTRARARQLQIKSARDSPKNNFQRRVTRQAAHLTIFSLQLATRNVEPNDRIIANYRAPPQDAHIAQRLQRGRLFARVKRLHRPRQGAQVGGERLLAHENAICRSLCFGLLLASTRTRRLELAMSLQMIARQISAARLVGRQLNHLPMIVGVSRIYNALHKAADSADASMELAVMVAYVVFQFAESAGWLAEAKLFGSMGAISAPGFNRLALYAWVFALVVSITQLLRRILVREAREDAARAPLDAPDKATRAARRLDRITLVGQCADFIGAINLLPHRILWANRLGPRANSTAFLIASLVGLYKCF